MTAPVDVCNVALLEAGQRLTIQSLTQPNNPAAAAANTFYLPTLRMLARVAPWDKMRAQIALTQYKAALINGALSTNPPPQPFLYEYLYPSDCIKVHFVLPTVQVQPQPPLTTAPSSVPVIAPSPTGIPYVVATDLDPNNNPLSVILTNLPNAQCIYTRDLSIFPDLWDPLFYRAATALLATYFINALARNATQYNEQAGIAKNMIDQARAASGNESISSVDRFPDWLQARRAGGGIWGWQRNAAVGAGGYSGIGGGFDQCVFPDGLRY